MNITSAVSATSTTSAEPDIGDIVHFMYGGDHVPAIVTGFPLPEKHGQVFLTVFLPNAQPFTTVAEYGDEIGLGTWLTATWHWPELTGA